MHSYCLTNSELRERYLIEREGSSSSSSEQAKKKNDDQEPQHNSVSYPDNVRMMSRIHESVLLI
jgi:hypothetical protein